MKNVAQPAMVAEFFEKLNSECSANMAVCATLPTRVSLNNPGTTVLAVRLCGRAKYRRAIMTAQSFSFPLVSLSIIVHVLNRVAGIGQLHQRFA